MTRHAHLDPAPFFFEGGPTGIILTHGWTGAPPEMRPLGEFLAARGLTVFGVRLAGHGTEPAEMNATGWHDWYADLVVAYDRMRARCERVFAGGISMGSLLTLHLAAQHPHPPAGIILYAPAIQITDHRLPFTAVLRFFVKLAPKDESAHDFVDPEGPLRVWSYEVNPVHGAYQLWRLKNRVRRELGQVTVPTLILHGRRDQIVYPAGAHEVYDRIASSDKTLHWFENSGHVITVDAEREQVWQATYDWIKARGPEGALRRRPSSLPTTPH
ncbi:MAG: alpha/beta fold hydrolase [Ardenticatenaceae bacterium]|nr:alpha/beta fold hydrolase [Ardenticatenaceae bacterium]